MTKKTVDLFRPVVPPARFNPRFEQIRTSPGYAPAREIMQRLAVGFDDPDGNFVEQFQTSGFDSRCWEFYLYACFAQPDYGLRRTHDRPDYLVTCDTTTVAVEAVTTNPPPAAGRPLPDPRIVSEAQWRAAIRAKHDELPIRFGSPLFSKLNKRYWELPQCQGLPLVFAIETFHEADALHFSSAVLAEYLYGLRQFPLWTEGGRLAVHQSTVRKHALGTKVIPSNFFSQPGANNVSAVLFSNGGTIAKFNRMGYQAGYGRDAIAGMFRMGTCFDPDLDAAEPAEFYYDVASPPAPETWEQGLTVLLNPQALVPLPLGFFAGTARTYLLPDGRLYTDVPAGLHPFHSKTVTLQYGRTPRVLHSGYRR